MNLFSSQHTKSEQRCYNIVFKISTSFQRPYNVVLTSCASWVPARRGLFPLVNLPLTVEKTSNVEVTSFATGAFDVGGLSVSLLD